MTAALAVVTVAVLLTATGVAVAAIPDGGSGLVHGCYSKKSGALRVIDVAKKQKCMSGEAGLNWNQRGINWRGGWSPSASYAKNDAVSRNGSSYLALKTSKKITPPNASYWAVLAAAGSAGAAGATGAAGPAGPAGAAGAAGATGSTGPQGPKGDTGLQGPKGDKGDTGIQGPAGVAPFKTVDMVNLQLSPTASSGNLTSITFAAPTDGAARLVASGYCGLTAANEAIFVEVDPTGAFASAWARSSGITAPGSFTTDSTFWWGAFHASGTFNVAAGSNTFYVNWSRRNGTGGGYCDGQLQVEFLTQQLS